MEPLQIYEFSNRLGHFRAHFTHRGLTRLQLISRDASPSGGTGSRKRILHVGHATEHWLDQYVKGERPPTPRLDLSALPKFHQKVLTQCQRIDYGTTKTYRELAIQSGSPLALRAVGQAMARNPIPIIIPCHRVVPVGKSWNLGSYSLAEGPGLKAALLNFERHHTHESLPPLIGFDRSPAHKHLLTTHLGPHIRNFRTSPLELKAPLPVFDYLVRAIIGQQVHPKAADSIHKRFLIAFGKNHIFETDRILRASIEELRACGLSPQKIIYIQGLARASLNRELPTYAELLLMSDAAIVQTLTRFHGIGTWTVQMLLIFFLGRPDVWPVDDLGIQKSLARVLKKKAVPSKKNLHKLGAAFQPYRSLASLYLWKLHS